MLDYRYTPDLLGIKVSPERKLLYILHQTCAMGDQERRDALDRARLWCWYTALYAPNRDIRFDFRALENQLKGAMIALL